MTDRYLPTVDVLAIGAHPDDVELGCAGTLLKLKSLGHSTAVLDLTRAELSTRGNPSRREEEAAEAARILGVEFRLNLELPDGSVFSTDESRRALIRILRECRPRLVITHSAVGHPDHWHTATLVREAAHHSGLARIETGQDRFRPEKIACWLEFAQSELPQVLVDVTSFHETKEKAIRAYASQLFDSGSGEPGTYLSQPDFLERVRSHDQFLGNLAGCRFAEGFLLSRLPVVEDLSVC